jgi:biopolymer transport protein ExbB
MEQGIGFAHFLTQTDGLGRMVLAALFLLSVASWYLITTKTVANLLARRRADVFLARFWQAHSLKEVRALLERQPPDNAFAGLTGQALEAVDAVERQGAQNLAAAGGFGELVTRALRNGIEQEAAQVESGLTVLASAGSSAPYIGLFGTVWSIYHALVNIGLAGQGTLDKVAGPVGEALIMTALGLAVAIPAVLAYNSFARRNRLWLARLDAFAHDLYVLVTVNAGTDGPSDARRPARPAAPHGGAHGDRQL